MGQIQIAPRCLLQNHLIPKYSHKARSNIGKGHLALSSIKSIRDRDFSAARTYRSLSRSIVAREGFFHLPPAAPNRLPPCCL